MNINTSFGNCISTSKSIQTIIQNGQQIIIEKTITTNPDGTVTTTVNQQIIN